MPGLHAWINHTESIARNQADFTPPFGFITKTSVEKFADSKIDSGELNSLFNQCEFINQHGSGGGICTGTPPPTPTPTPTPDRQRDGDGDRNCNCNCDGNSNANRNRHCHRDPDRHTNHP